MTLKSIQDKIRAIDPEATIVEHPTILYAYRVTVSRARHLGHVILEVEKERFAGVYVAYNFNGKDYYTPFSLLMLNRKNSHDIKGFYGGFRDWRADDISLSIAKEEFSRASYLVMMYSFMVDDHRKQ